MRRALALLPPLLLLAGPAGADEVILQSGKTLRGTVFRTASEVRVNPYRSSRPEMTWGVESRSPGEVREVRPEDDPPALFAALDALPREDVPGRRALLARAKKGNEREIARRIAEEILREDPKDPEALRAVGGPEAWEERRALDPRLDPEWGRALRRVVELETAADRRREAERLFGSRNATAPTRWIERVASSLQADRGERHDIPVRRGGDLHAGGTYSRFVPYEIDPMEPAPLLLVLHGGSLPGAKPTAVLGTGKEALPLFVEGARRLGAVVVAPTAPEAPWATPKNEAFLEAVLDETAALWNVDLDRVFAAGEGSGGEGALWFASRAGERFAVAGAAAAVPSGLPASIAARGIAVWLYHGEADDLIPVGEVRRMAERLEAAHAPFAYCELPGQGHGFPPAAEADFWEFVAPRRRPRARSAWPRSSFDREPDDAERVVLGDPAEAWGTGIESASPDELVARIAAGRPSAEAAARRLLEDPPPGLAERVRAIVKDRSVPIRGRGWAAWLLGRLGDGDSLEALGDCVRGEKDPSLLRQAASALRALGGDGAVEDLRSALADASARWKRLSFPGERVPYFEYRRACLLLAELVEALGALGKSPDLAADIEAAAVIGVFRDARGVAGRADRDEDPSVPRARLARACGRAYRALRAERTLYEMLAAVLRADRRAVEAAAAGAAEGLPPPAGPARR